MRTKQKIGDRRVRRYIVVAERALGKRLPRGVVVHHIDFNEENDSPSNLVICPNAAYHRLLHRRTEALEACGNANWVKCPYCKKWDDPINPDLYIGKETIRRKVYHRSCLYKRWKNQERSECQQSIPLSLWLFKKQWRQ